MKLQNVLVAQLETLSVALEDPGTDLHAILSVLTDDISAAIASFLGLVITVHVADEAITISTMTADSDTARTSMLLPLPPATGISVCELVLYAATPGAFTDLAADINVSPGPTGTRIDAHLPPPTARLYPNETIGISDVSQINQAIGVLIDAGASVSEARTTLRTQANQDGATMTKVARRLLRRL